jgi:hypothetical protein
VAVRRRGCPRKGERLARRERPRPVAAAEGVGGAGQRLDGQLAPLALGLRQRATGEEHEVAVVLAEPEIGASAVRRPLRDGGAPAAAAGEVAQKAVSSGVAPTGRGVTKS